MIFGRSYPWASVMIRCEKCGIAEVIPGDEIRERERVGIEKWKDKVKLWTPRKQIIMPSN